MNQVIFKRLYKYLKKLCIIFIGLLLILSSYLAVKVYKLEYDQNLVSDQQAFDIAYGKALKQCIDSDKDFDCKKISAFNKSYEDINRVWTFDFTTLVVNNQEKPPVFETRIYINFNGSEISQQEYKKY